MSCKIKILIAKMFVLAMTIVLQACGVKGDPLPPVTPAELGRGRPAYRGATEGLKVERRSKSVNQKGKNANDESEDDEDDREEDGI